MNIHWWVISGLVVWNIIILWNISVGTYTDKISLLGNSITVRMDSYSERFHELCCRMDESVERATDKALLKSKVRELEQTISEMNQKIQSFESEDVLDKIIERINRKQL